VSQDLDSLLTGALLEQASRTPKKARSPNENYRACFTKPENWLLVGQVRLVHVEGSVYTLIGLFNEQIHKTVPKCRWLTAAATIDSALPQKSEEVRGKHWLPDEVLGFKQRQAERKLILVVDLILDMGQHLRAGAVVCEAHLLGGGLQRLTLWEDTVFEGTTPRTILRLPAGLDVLEGLLGGCKVLVWRSINEELAHGT